MASLSLVALLVALVSCYVAALPGPFLGYQTSFATSQTQSSYDPKKGYSYSTVSVTSPQCSVIKRSTRYERVNVPFLCHARTGRVMPLPRVIEPQELPVLQGMKMDGWVTCHKPLQVPIHRFQRIPACCPGTIPTQTGGCVNKQSGTAQPNDTPTPGQLLQSIGQQVMRDTIVHQILRDASAVHQAFQYRPTPPVPIVLQAPRPYRVVLNRAPQMGQQPGRLIQQVLFPRGQAGPSYTTDRRGQGTVNMNNLMNSPARPQMPRQPMQMPRPQMPMPRPQMPMPRPPMAMPRPQMPMPRPPMAMPRPPMSHMSDWHNDVARYLAAMMYQKLLVEQQHQMLKKEIESQSRLRKQMEMFILQQSLLAQQGMHQMQNGGQGRVPTSSPVSPNTDPSPIPPPPVNGGQTTPFTKQPPATQTGNGGSHTEEDGQKNDSNGPVTSREGGIVEEHIPQHRQPTTGARPPMFTSNGPTNMSPVSLRQKMMELQEKVKGILKGCMEKAGVADNPMEQVVQSGDLTKLRPVCKAHGTISPCMMEQTATSFGKDQMGMVGRQMMQSVFLSIGQMCMRLSKMDQILQTPKMTSPPVFPNPAPSMTKAAVTEGTPVEKQDADSPTGPQTSGVVEEEPVKQFAKPLEAPTTPKPSSSPVQEEQEVEVAEAAFPMWMILTMVGACAALLLFCCLTVCLVLRCRRKKKTVELDREPEKLPVPAEANIYAASPCVPPPAYVTTAVKQTLGGEEEEEGEVMDDKDFKIPEDEGQAEKEEEKKE